MIQKYVINENKLSLIIDRDLIEEKFKRTNILCAGFISNLSLIFLKNL